MAPTPGSGSTGHCHQAALCSEDSSSSCLHARAAPGGQGAHAGQSVLQGPCGVTKNIKHQREV